MLNFNVSKTESNLIDHIVKRACKHYPGLDKLEFSMDVTVTHANGNPLRLHDLLNAPDLDFCHDIFGIYIYLDRSTGKLKDCFSPRYSE